jgi:tripartite ATP-independent transporter DctP family solute receptor
MGDIQFLRVGTNVLSPLNPKMNALTMPFLYRDTEHAFKVLDGPIGEEFRQSLQDQGLLGLCWFDSGSRNFYNTKKPIRTPADMTGLKIRVQETKLMVGIVEALGASATPMPYGDVYPGMQNNLIDGAENNWPSFITAAHVEVAKYFVENGHVRAPEMILVNTDTWNAFSAEEQKIIRECALEAATFQREEWARQEADYKQQAIAAGVEVVELTPEERQLFVDAMAGLYEDPEYAVYADVYEAIRNTK